MHARLTTLLSTLLGGLLVLAFLAPVASAEDGSAGAERQAAGVTGPPLVFLVPLESYAGYQPQTRCRKRPQPGTLLLADWLVARGGALGPVARSCAGSSTSEHKEARAIDWMLDARSATDRAVAQAFLDEVLAPDELGNPHALARRMGLMYVIWKDKIYRSYDGFTERSYLSSGCRRRKGCSVTLRHRDHMHLSLTRQAARGTLSWYQAMQLQLPPAPAPTPVPTPASRTSH